jgi:uncharacterized protein (DUF2141 family)/preprotein translocase subunit SecG
VYETLKKNSSSGDSQVKWRSLSVAALLIIVVLLSAGSGLYAGASFFAQQANVTITTTTTIYTTSWTTSTIWSTVTSVVYGVWTTVQYTTSTSTVTVTSSTSSRTGTFGTTSNSGSVGGLANYIFATKYTLSQAGTVVSVSVYSLNAGHVKAGIFADSGGVPGSLLAANNAATTVTAGQWTTISIGPVGLTAGTYWIAFNEDANSLRIYKAGIARQAAYMPYAFSNNMPTTWSVNGYWNFDYICYATYTY